MDFNNLAQQALDAPFRAQQKRTELAQLLEFLSQFKLKNILELGVYKGGTLKAWLSIAERDAYAIGIDLPNGNYGGGFTPNESLWIKRSVISYEQKVELLAEDTHKTSTVDKVKAFFNEQQIDFLFIDADHTYNGARTDFEMYSPLVRKGGVIAMHDIVKHTYYPEVEVYKFWEELKIKYKNVKEFIDLDYPTDHGHWGGLGVIQL